MKTKLLSIVISVMLILSLVLVTACGEGGKDDDSSNKSVMKIYSFTGGFGAEWLNSLIKDYEEANKDTVFEEGKVGIKIEATEIKSSVAGSDMKNREEVIYFLEQQDYYSLTQNNYLSDITPAITGENKYESGKTLESKMFDSQKAYLGRNVDGETHYYAYPHYTSTSGIAYDVDLFDNMGFYFAEGYYKDGALEDMFVGKNWEGNVERTVGPDGVKGTSDDGLPVDYTEFLNLCDYIDSQSYNPLIWSGEVRKSYLNQFVNSLAAQSEGYEQMYLNFSLSGEAKTLGSIVDGEFVLDSESTVLDGSNSYEIARQAGKYYAMKFYYDLYNRDYIKSQTQTLYGDLTYTDAQDFFLIKNNRYAMLIEGSWWYEEADEFIEQQAEADPSYSKENRNIGYMPLPKYDGCTTEGNTMFDIMYPLLMVKKLDTSDWKYTAALDFIQFANTDEQLAKFTEITCCTKALNYTIENAETELCPYAYSYYSAYRSAAENNQSIVFPYNNNKIFASNQSKFTVINSDGLGLALYKSTAYSTFFIEAVEKGVTLDDYFNGMYKYFKDLRIWEKIS